MHIAKVNGAEDLDLVVITNRESSHFGSIGRLHIDPGFETVRIAIGCLHVRQETKDVRAVVPGDRLVLKR